MKVFVLMFQSIGLLSQFLIQSFQLQQLYIHTHTLQHGHILLCCSCVLPCGHLPTQPLSLHIYSWTLQSVDLSSSVSSPNSQHHYGSIQDYKPQTSILKPMLHLCIAIINLLQIKIDIFKFSCNPSLGLIQTTILALKVP